MHSDRVSTTGSESRKSSKPIMEKRRRARINASLAELKSLLLEVIKKEGARHSKMEKADILEMAVKHLRQIQRQQYTAGGNDPTLSDKYRLGFNECAQEVSRYLGASDDDDAELRARLLNHLANCIASSDSPSPVSTPSTSPAPPPLGHSLGNVAPAPSSSGSVTVTPLTPIPVRPAAAKPATPAFSVAAQSAAGGIGGGVTSSTALLVPASEINNNNANLANNNLINISNSAGSDGAGHHVTLTSASSPQTLHVPSATKVFGELQVVPPKTGNGEVAFVLPANVMAGGQLPSYIIPLPVQFPIMASPQVSAAVATSGAAPGLVTLTAGSGFIPPVSMATGFIPPASVGQVVNGSLSWQSAPALSNSSPNTVASLVFTSSSPVATVTSTVSSAEDISLTRPSTLAQTRDGSLASPVQKRVTFTQPTPPPPPVEAVKPDTCGQMGQRGPRGPLPLVPDQGKDVWRPW